MHSGPILNKILDLLWAIQLICNLHKNHKEGGIYWHELSKWSLALFVPEAEQKSPTELQNLFMSLRPLSHKET